MSSEVVVRRFSDEDTESLRSIIRGADERGELVGFHRSEVRDWLEMVAVDGPKTWVAESAGKVIGFLSDTTGSIIVDPAHRRRGVGSRLVASARNETPDLELAQWSHSAETAAFLTSVGYRFDHLLFRLLRSHAATPEAPEIAPGFTLITYDAAFFDEYVELVKQSFADHPTPMTLDVDFIRAVHARPTFDPTMIGLIRDEQEHRLVSFVRLRKIETEDGLERGAVALLGTLPDSRGKGFARTLLRWAILRFDALGIEDVELEVVATNKRALPLYTGEGFQEVISWPYWVPKTDQ